VFTQCSKCETIFRVSAEVLRSAGGQVRCGRCGEVFDALARLAEQPTQFTVGESPLELETRADHILQSTPSARAPESALEEFESEESPEESPDVEVARLEIQDGLDFDLSGDDPALEFTLPPGELDRIFVDPKLTRAAAVPDRRAAADAGAPAAEHPQTHAADDDATPASAFAIAIARGAEAAEYAHFTLSDDAVHSEESPTLEFSERTGAAAHAAVDEPIDAGTHFDAGVQVDPGAHVYAGAHADAGARADAEAQVGADEHAERAVRTDVPSDERRNSSAGRVRAAPVDVGLSGRSVDALRAAIVRGPAADAPREWRAMWIVVGAALVILLGLQLMHQNRAWLAANTPLAGPLRFVYEKLGAPIPVPLNLTAYQLRQFGVTGDPDANGALRVRASILNSAGDFEPYPLLRVALADRFGNRIGGRDFEPAEYLGRPVARLLSPGERIDATLNILDPGKDAEGFEIDVCLRGPERTISCANDAAQRLK
jgi:predicted Zn finger-like uncharacterized protein